MSFKRFYHNDKHDRAGYCCLWESGPWNRWYKKSKKYINTRVRQRLKKEQKEQEQG